jgi:cellulose synthase (UDP-forming)
VTGVFLLHSVLAAKSTYYMLGAILLLFVLFLAGKKSEKWRKFFLFFTIGYNLVYLVWRVGFTLPVSLGVASAALSILLLAAELLGFWQSLVYRMLFVKGYQKEEHPLSDMETPPTVDVFIATYNEGLSILRRTIIACLNLDYPADRIQIHLCDDGHRPEARALCEELGIHYITRKGNLHAKAGNLNNALAQTSASFAMLLDADMVPKSNFLQKTVGAFLDDKVGFVQTPQMFFNPDPFQFNLHFNQKIPNEQDFFMMDIQAGRAGYNAVLHVGTNAVFRRSALDEIGGIPTGTITEDMATGMLLQAKGYRSVFIREVLCTGLSVESFGDLIRQRERWCRGNIQVAKKWNPLKIKGLSLAQRAIYIDGIFYWFFGVQKIIYLVSPLIYLIFGTVILSARFNSLLVFWLPSFLACLLSHRLLSNNSRSTTWSHIYEVALAPYLAMAALMEELFSRPIPFRVTPKGINTQKTTFVFRTALPHIVLLTLTITGWTVTAFHIIGGQMNAGSVFINVGWSLYNVIAIVMSILVCIERPRERIAERVTTGRAAEVHIDGLPSCRLLDISETGAKLECDIPEDRVTTGADVLLESNLIGQIEGRIVWKRSEKGKTALGIKFAQYSTEVYKRVMKIVADENKGYHDNHT